MERIVVVITYYVGWLLMMSGMFVCMKPYMRRGVSWREYKRHIPLSSKARRYAIALLYGGICIQLVSRYLESWVE